jgi:hypothetical protein
MASIYAIVEGHGEVKSVPVLLRRIAAEIAPTTPLNCLVPHLLSRTKFKDRDAVSRALTIGIARLRPLKSPTAILFLMDADGDCPKEMREDFLSTHQTQLKAIRHSVIFAVREFEAWFLAANLTQAHHRDLKADCLVIEKPEEVTDAKGLFKKSFISNGVYASSVDQVRFASIMDIKTARRAASFDKLWRDLEEILVR